MQPIVIGATEMGVQTTADAKLDEARSLTQKALKALNEIIINECWGHDKFNEAFTKQILESHALLIEVRSKLSQ